MFFKDFLFVFCKSVCWTDSHNDLSSFIFKILFDAGLLLSSLLNCHNSFGKLLALKFGRGFNVYRSNLSWPFRSIPFIKVAYKIATFILQQNKTYANCQVFISWHDELNAHRLRNALPQFTWSQRPQYSSRKGWSTLSYACLSILNEINITYWQNKYSFYNSTSLLYTLLNQCWPYFASY